MGNPKAANEENTKLIDKMTEMGHGCEELKVISKLGHNTVVNARRNRSINIKSAIAIADSYDMEVWDLFENLRYKKRDLDLSLSKDLLLVKSLVANQK